MLLTENNYLICVSLQDKLFGTLPFVKEKNIERKRERERERKRNLRNLQ